MRTVHIVHPALDQAATVPPSTAKVLARTGWVESDPTEVPDGTVEEVTEWVGDDPVRATTARAVESKRPEPRVTLLDQLDRSRRGHLDEEPNLPDRGSHVPLEED
jgi:hypothetical protein